MSGHLNDSTDPTDGQNASSASGRKHFEPADPIRGPFELDRHRIVESTAFRRLEGKTQVFAPAFHDHFRTRLTHTLEAAQIARTLARGLGADSELAEAITLAHDLGHPPFGHAGEAALDEAMSGRGGFNHNAHSVRVVEYLEHPFPAFRGLNLTRETLDGLRAHCTRYDRPDDGGGGSVRASLEAQAASIADRIAYNCHDLEDAIGAEFFGLVELAELVLWREALEPLNEAWPRGKAPLDATPPGGTAPLNPARPGGTAPLNPALPGGKAPLNPALPGRPIHAIRRAVLDNLLNALLADAIRTARLSPKAVASDVGGLGGGPAVAFSDRIEAGLVELERFLVANVYRRNEIAEMDARGRSMILSLFEAYRDDPGRLPPRFSARIGEQGAERVICDYIAGLTDRYCKAEFEELCG